MPFPPCQYCGVNGPCIEGCDCAKCADPESYARFKNDPVRYYRWIEKQRMLARQQEDVTRAVRRTDQTARQLAVLGQALRELENPDEFRRHVLERFRQIFQGFLEDPVTMPELIKIRDDFWAGLESSVTDESIEASLWRTFATAMPQILEDASSVLSEVHAPLRRESDDLTFWQ